MAGELHDGAVRREVAAKDAQRAARLERLRDRRDHLAVGIRGAPPRARRSFARRPSAHRCRGGPAAASSRLAVPPTRCRSPATNRPPGVRLVTTGVDAERRSKSSSSSGTPASSAIASRCSTEFVEPPVPATPTIAFSDPRGRDDRRGTDVPRDHVEHEAPRLLGRRGLRGIGRRDPAEADRPEAEEVDRDGHRVGGEVAGAGADAGARVAPRARRAPRR